MTYTRPPRLELVCSYTATLQPPEVIGPVAEGIRVNFYVTGGQLEGPGIKGKVRPVGGDWLTVRPDGVGVLDVRATLELEDTALVDVAYRGLGDLGPEGYERFVRGDLPATLPLRTCPILRSAHPSWQWLQREVFIGFGAVDFARLQAGYDVYVVR
jgi:Protein of unknown function (DUF3237)